jgi:hypothetical protein
VGSTLIAGVFVGLTPRRLLCAYMQPRFGIVEVDLDAPQNFVLGNCPQTALLLDGVRVCWSSAAGSPTGIRVRVDTMAHNPLGPKTRLH